jgi:RNA polymerase sigma-70 factor, ECF subfamily
MLVSNSDPGPATLDPPARGQGEAVPEPVTRTAPEVVGDFADIFKQYFPFAFRALRRLGVTDADADDVCQNVFLTVHRKLPTFEGRSSVRTWIYSICVNAASDYRRSGRRRHEIVTDEVEEEVIPATQHEQLGMRRARVELERILDTLDDEKRAVFVLYEIEQLPMNGVAVAVGCPLATAYSRLHAAREHVEGAVKRLQARGGTR